MKYIEKVNSNNINCYCKIIGNTSYVVHVHFSEMSKQTMGEKIKRLIGEEIRQNDNTENIMLK